MVKDNTKEGKPDRVREFKKLFEDHKHEGQLYQQLRSGSAHDVNMAYNALQENARQEFGLQPTDALAPQHYEKTAQARLSQTNDKVTSLVKRHAPEIVAKLPAKGLESALMDVEPVQIKGAYAQTHNDIAKLHTDYLNMHGRNMALQQKKINPNEYVAAVAKEKASQIESRLKKDKDISKKTIDLWKEVTIEIVTYSPLHAARVGQQLEQERAISFKTALDKAAKERQYGPASYVQNNIAYQKDPQKSTMQIARVLGLIEAQQNIEEN